MLSAKSLGLGSWVVNSRAQRKPRRARALGVALVSMLVEAGAVWRRGGRLGGNVIVRCREGHLFTTIWIPGVSLKSLRLGGWRFQHCPVGHHWAVVAPINEADLTEQELRTARAHRDLRLP